jgi:hypothetical protein
MVTKKVMHGTMIALAATIFVITLGSTLFFDTSYTGYVVGDFYSDNVDIPVKYSQDFLVADSNLESHSLNAFGVTGKVIGEGNAEIYLEDANGQRVLVYSNKPKTGFLGITGLVPGTGQAKGQEKEGQAKGSDQGTKTQTGQEEEPTDTTDSDSDSTDSDTTDTTDEQKGTKAGADKGTKTQTGHQEEDPVEEPTEEPVIEEPTTEENVTEEPVVEEPVVEEPTEEIVEETPDNETPTEENAENDETPGNDGEETEEEVQEKVEKRKKVVNFEDAKAIYKKDGDIMILTFGNPTKTEEPQPKPQTADSIVQKGVVSFVNSCEESCLIPPTFDMSLYRIIVEVDSGTSVEIDGVVYK